MCGSNFNETDVTLVLKLAELNSYRPKNCPKFTRSIKTCYILIKLKGPLASFFQILLEALQGARELKNDEHHKIDTNYKNLLDEMLEDEFENCKICLGQPLDQFAKFQHFYASVRNH